MEKYSGKCQSLLLAADKYLVPGRILITKGRLGRLPIGQPRVKWSVVMQPLQHNRGGDIRTPVCVGSVGVSLGFLALRIRPADLDLSQGRCRVLALND